VERKELAREGLLRRLRICGRGIGRRGQIGGFEHV
jgi:hypothetical protein